MDPSAPSQPPLNTAYAHPSNPTEQNPAEKSSSQSTGASLRRTDAAMDQRVPGDVPSQGPSGQEDATPSALGMGGHGEKDNPDIGGPVSNVEGEQMRAPGEGDVKIAVDNKHGQKGEASLTSDMDRKRAEQDQLKEARREDGVPGGPQGGPTGGHPGEGQREENRGVDVKSALGGGSNIVGA